MATFSFGTSVARSTSTSPMVAPSFNTFLENSTSASSNSGSSNSGSLSQTPAFITASVSATPPSLALFKQPNDPGFQDSKTSAFGSRTTSPSFEGFKEAGCTQPSTLPFSSSWFASPQPGIQPIAFYPSAMQAFGTPQPGVQPSFGFIPTPASAPRFEVPKPSLVPPFGVSAPPAFQESCIGWRPPSSIGLASSSCIGWRPPSSLGLATTSSSDFAGCSPTTHDNNQQGGSSIAPYCETNYTEGKLMSMSAMNVYSDKCHEELRWKDYKNFQNKGLKEAGCTQPSTLPFSSSWFASPQPGLQPIAYCPSTTQAFGTPQPGVQPSFGVIPTPAPAPRFGVSTPSFVPPFGVSAPRAFQESKTHAFGFAPPSSVFGPSSSSGIGWRPPSSIGLASSSCIGWRPPSSIGLAATSSSDFAGCGPTTRDNNQQGGSFIAPYCEMHYTEGKLMSISAMNVYSDKCHEELRWKDHKNFKNNGTSSSTWQTERDGLRCCNCKCHQLNATPTETATGDTKGTSAGMNTFINYNHPSVAFSVPAFVTFIHPTTLVSPSQHFWSTAASNTTPFGSQISPTNCFGLTTNTIPLVPKMDAKAPSSVTNPVSITSEGPSTRFVGSFSNWGFACPSPPSCNTFAANKVFSYGNTPSNELKVKEADKFGHVSKGPEFIIEKLGFNPWSSQGKVTNVSKLDCEGGKILPCEEADKDEDIIALAEFAVAQHNALQKDDQVIFRKVVDACLEAVEGGRYHIVLGAVLADSTNITSTKMHYAVVLRKGTVHHNPLTVLEKWLPCKA